MTNLTTGDSISETGEFLSQNPPPFSQSTVKSPAGTPIYSRAHNDARMLYDGCYNSNNGYNNQSTSYNSFANMPDVQNNAVYGSANNSMDRGRGNDFKKNAKRSVQLSNLADNVTIADVEAVIRGGMLLELYFRDHDRSVVVSFLDEGNAQDFFRSARRNDLYIRGKRVSKLKHNLLIIF